MDWYCSFVAVEVSSYAPSADAFKNSAWSAAWSAWSADHADH